MGDLPVLTPRQHARTRASHTNCHFNPTHIDGSCNPADLFTKALARPTFWKHVQTVLEGLTDLWKALSAATKLNCPGLAVAAFVRFYEALVPWYR